MLNKLNDDGLMTGMLMMRRHEKDFIMRLDQKYVEAMKQAAEKFAKKLAASSIPADQQATIGEKLAAYQRDFLAFAEASLEATGAIAELSKAHATAEPQIEAFARLEREAAGAQKQASASAISATSAQIGWAIVAIALLVALTGAATARGIARPLVRMAKLTERLAQGAVDIEVTDTERATRSAPLRAPWQSSRRRRSRRGACRPSRKS